MITTVDKLISDELFKHGGLSKACKDPAFYECKASLRKVLKAHKPVMIQILPSNVTVAYADGSVHRYG